jgi:hypothetical protein
MSDAAGAQEKSTGIVQCGWCPMLLADDYVVWCLHFAEVHNYTGGYSISHISGTDWDVAELMDRGQEQKP